MPTITFKVSDREAKRIRAQAHAAQLSVSEYLRQKAGVFDKTEAPISQIRCPHTGALIFAATPQFEPLTTESVKSMLVDFP
jgi:hypothetical protein